jgi:hypothetical protein
LRPLTRPWYAGLVTRYDVRERVLIGLLALCALAPSLFLVPHVWVYRVFAVVADLGLLAACLYVSGRLRAPALVVTAFAAVFGTVALVVASELAPFALVYAALALAVGLSLAIGSRLRRTLFAYVVASGTSAKWLLCAAASLQAGDMGRPLARPGGICRVDEIVRPGRRYNLVTSASGDLVASFFPQEGRTEVYAVGIGATEPARTLPIAPNRVASAREQRRVYGVDYGRGLFTLSLDDLSLIEAPPSSFSGHFYMGIAYRASAAELLILRGDGLLTHVDRDTRAVRAEVDLLAGEWIRFEEEVHALYLTQDERFAAIVKSNGPMWLYDTERRQVTARRWLLGPTGNIVFSPAGERLFVVTLFNGRLHELRLPDLVEIASTPLGMGFRYLRLAHDGRHLMAGNYFTGAVAVIDLESHAVVARVSVGQRIQWIEPHGQGEQYWVSHEAGITLLDLPCLASKRPEEPPLATLSAELLPAHLVRALRARSHVVDAGILVNLAIVLGALRGCLRRPAKRPPHGPAEDA